MAVMFLPCFLFPLFSKWFRWFSAQKIQCVAPYGVAHSQDTIVRDILIVYDFTTPLISWDCTVLLSIKCSTDHIALQGGCQKFLKKHEDDNKDECEI